MPGRSTEHRDKFTNRYLVKRILSERSQDGITYYLVEWDGYALEDCSWEPRSNFHDENSFIRWAVAQDEGDILPPNEVREIEQLVEERHRREAAEKRRRKDKKLKKIARKTAPPVTLTDEPSPRTTPIKEERTQPSRPLNPLLIPEGSDIIVIDDEDEADGVDDRNDTGDTTPTNHDRMDTSNDRSIDKRKDSVQVTELPCFDNDNDIEMTEDDPTAQEPIIISSDDDEPEENIIVSYDKNDDLESITLKLGSSAYEASGSEFEPDDSQSNDASSPISPPATQSKPKQKQKQKAKRASPEPPARKRGRLIQGTRRRVVESDSDDD